MGNQMRTFKNEKRIQTLKYNTLMITCVCVC